MRTHTIILICALLVACEHTESTDRAEGSPAIGSAQTEAGSAEYPSTQAPAGERIRAVTLDAREAPSDSVLHAIRDLGASHLALITFGFQEHADDPQIRFSPDVRWYSESESGIRELAERAADLGMEIILKPQLWLRGGAWTADIGFDSDEAWQQWMSDYSAYLMHVAELAEAIGADILVVGTELGNAARERPAFWEGLITKIRGVYGGKLTYAANWHDDYEQVPFWESLDFIGIQAYFPISAVANTTLSELQQGWTAPLAAIEALSSRKDLPVLFTEIGYRSVSYAAEEPWRWPSREESVAADTALQADLYRAFFAEVWPKSWFAGAIIWKFYPEGFRRPVDLDFTPQGKPAEKVIREGFIR